MKFATKLTIIVLGVLIFSTVIISTAVYRSNTKTLENQIKGRQIDTASNIMDMIDRMLFERFADIKVIASDPVVSSRDSTPRQIRERLSEFRNYYKTYISISLFDLNRVKIADTSGLDIGVQYPLDKYWEDVLEGKDFIMEVSESVSLKQTVIRFGFPVTDKSGEAFGIVVSRVPINKLYYIIRGVGNIQTEPEGWQADLVDKDGLLLYSTYNRKGILKDNLTKLGIVRNLFVRQEVSTGRFTHDVIENIYVFVHEQGYLDFKGNDWSLLTHIPTNIAFAPAVKLRNKVFFILIVVLAFSIFIVLYLSRILTRPIVELIRGAEIIGKGNFNYKIQATTKDEVGVLVGAFNKMTDSLRLTTVSRDYVDNILENMMNCLVVSDSDGTIQTVNQTTLKLLGYTENELIGKPIGMIFAEEEEEEEEINLKGTGIEDIIKKGFVSVIEKTYLTKDGRKTPVFFSSSVMYTRLASESLTTHDATDNILGVVCVAQDITERKKVEKEIKHIASFPQLNVNPILEVNLSGSITFHNNAASKVLKKLGLKEDLSLFLPKNIDEIIYDLQGNEKMSLYREVGIGNLTFEENIHLIPEFKVLRIYTRDITERKKAEKLLNEQKKDLEQKNIALKEVLGQIEIEKKQIKDNVIANAENLLLPVIQKLKLKGESRKYVQLLQKNLQELTSSFGTKLTNKRAKLTSREIEICDMIKNGLTSKEIASLLNINLRTTEKHRANIRNKLGIIKKDISLTSFLKTL